MSDTNCLNPSELPDSEKQRVTLPNLEDIKQHYGLPMKNAFLLQKKLNGLGSVAEIYQSYLDTFSLEEITESGKLGLLKLVKVTLSAHKYFVARKGLRYGRTTNIYRILVTYGKALKSAKVLSKICMTFQNNNFSFIDRIKKQLCTFVKGVIHK